MPNPVNFNMPNQPPIKPGSMMYGGFTPPYRMPGYSPTEMSGFLNAGGSPTFSNAWTAHMLRPQDIKPRVQPQFNGVTPQQMMSARNGFRSSLGMGPVQQKPMTPPVMGNPAGGPMQPAGPNLHQIEKPPITPVPLPGRAAPIGNYTPAAYQPQPQFTPSQQGLNTFKSVMGGGQMPAGPGGRLPSEYMLGSGQGSQPQMGESSFANRRTWTPAETAMMNHMNQQQDAQQQKEWYQYKNPNWRYDSNVDELNRQADVKERTQLPDATDPNWKPNDWKDNMADIPGSMWGEMRNRFNAINRNRQQSQTPQETMLSQVPTSGQFPNYAQRLWEANPEIAGNLHDPTYMSDNRITPTPRAARGADGVLRAGTLTPTEAAQMRAVGSSAGDWNAKADWMRSKGYSGNMTPAQSQEYANERQKVALERNAKAWDVEHLRNTVADQRRERKLNQRMQNFQYQNPGLFANINPNSAQFYAMMNGADLRQFNEGGVTPLQERQLALQERGMNYQAAAATEDPVLQERLLNAAQGGGGMGTPQNATVFDGNPYRSPPSAYGAPSENVPMMDSRSAALRSTNTPQDQKTAILRRWADAGHKPTPAEMDAAGITNDDIVGFYNYNGYGPGNAMDSFWDMTGIGDGSSRPMRQRYRWAGQQLNPNQQPAPVTPQQQMMQPGQIINPYRGYKWRPNNTSAR